MSKISGTICYSVFVPLLFIGHVLWNLFVGYWLFDLAGGIRPSFTPGGWTALGGIDRAWGTPLYIPGCHILTESNIGGCIWRGGEWGLPLLLMASLITAIATAQFMQALINKSERKLGVWYWRGVVMFLGWAFIPMPVKWTFAYQITVLC